MCGGFHSILRNFRKYEYMSVFFPLVDCFHFFVSKKFLIAFVSVSSASLASWFKTRILPLIVSSSSPSCFILMA